MAMFASPDKQLHWTQRVALVRHNFHAARQSGDFSFFKILQAHAFLQGADYVSTLTAALGNDADATFNTLDNLNTGMAYVFQDAFKNVHDEVKVLMMGDQEALGDIKAQLRVDVLQQVQRADFAIDRIVNSAINLIQLQPEAHQNDIACAWILGATIVADAIALCLREMNSIEDYVTDFIHLENSWATVQASVQSSITALRGILNMMSLDEPTREFKRRSSSSATSFSGVMRKFSTAMGMSNGGFHLQQPPPPYKKNRESASSVEGATTASSLSNSSQPAALRYSFANAIPTRMPRTPRSSVSTIGTGGHSPKRLETIPCTPADSGMGMVDPFTKIVTAYSNDGSEHDGVDSKDHYMNTRLDMVDPLQVDVGA